MFLRWASTKYSNTLGVVLMSIRLESKLRLISITISDAGFFFYSRYLILIWLFYRTKIFIKFPKTLFKTEDLLEKRKHELGGSDKWLTLDIIKLLIIASYILLLLLYYTDLFNFQLPKSLHSGVAIFNRKNIGSWEKQVRHC